MKKYFFAVLFLCSFYTLPAQSNYNVEKQQFKISILNPGFGYEVATGENTTVDLRLGTGLALRGASNVKTEFGIFPFFEGQYRWYYNFNRRKGKGKRTAHNSANYLALSSTLVSGKPLLGNLEGNEGYWGNVGPVYGLQRTYKRGFNLNLEFGFGYSFDNLGNSGISPKIGFALGWVLK
ncbi:MAG: hypothetical protein V3U92_02800 [Cellulophaga sp.]